MFTEQIRELNKTNKGDIFDLYETTGDIVGLVASISAGCRGCIPDLVADVDHMRDVVSRLNKACEEAGKPPLCSEFEEASNAQIISSVILHSRKIKQNQDLSWLDKITK